MPRLFSAVSIFCALLASLIARPASAANGNSTHVKTVRVMIRLQGPPLAANPSLKARTKATQYRFRLDPSLYPARWYSNALVQYQSKELSYLRAHGIHLKVARQFHVLFNGFAAEVPVNELPKLRTLTNVSAVLADRKTVVPQLDRSVPLVNATKAWADLGGSAKAGKGLYIADIDTGIDMTNPCFSATGIAAPPIARRADNSDNFALTNNKVPVIRAIGSYDNQKFSAKDVEGHGTFTASIEACDYNTPTPLGTPVSGMAPAAYLMVYNIRPDGDDGGGFQDADIRAFELALQDGADVANYSFGSIFGAGDEREDPSVAALNLATKAGLSFVVSAGNSGPTPQSISSPSTATSVISVGAATNARAVAAQIHLSASGSLPAELKDLRAGQGSHAFTSPIGPAPMVYVGLGRLPNQDADNEKADDLAGKDLKGKIAVIDRGNIFFEQKINNVAAAGAVGAIIVDNHAALFPFGFDMRTATLPSMSLTETDGQALEKYIQSHPDSQVTLDPTKIILNETPNILSDFSSRGYGPDYRIKPDLVAPGQDIYAAVETDAPAGELYDRSGFASADGTSFSGPHVAGGVALVLEKHPTWTPAVTKAVIMETANSAALDDPFGSPAPVMDVGSGLLDVDAALNSPAYLAPSSFSLGQVNVGSGAQQQTTHLQLNDISGGSGAWSVSVRQLHGATGFNVNVPSSVNLSANGHVDVPVTTAEMAQVANGDYDGYIVLQHGSQTLHVPYFAHVISKAVAPGSVLLVDATTSKFIPSGSTPSLPHLDVTKWYTDALKSIGKSYTYWDEAQLGSPSVADMKKASAVIYYSGRNLNGWGHENSDYQSLLGPIGSIDLSSIHSYMDAGGHVFLSGMGIALSGLTGWDQFVLGSDMASLSEYDNARNDKNATGGISPPSPSAKVENRSGVLKNQYMFSGMKPIDFSTKGDGAGDNLAIESEASTFVFATDNDPEKLVGVTALSPVQAKDSFYGSAFGQAILQTTNLQNAVASPDVGVVNSDEPSLKHKANYPGRSVLFSFGFEGINDNTGYATRAQVLKRIFDWFDDKPVAKVSGGGYKHGKKVQLRATVKAASGVHVASYTWKIGSTSLKTTTKPSTFTFPHKGTYKVQVQIVDSLGHAAVSAVSTVRAR